MITLVVSNKDITNNSSCYDCGIQFSDEAFDWHHIDAYVFKNYSGNQLTKKIDELVNLKKINKPWQNCIMLCYRCHQLRHVGFDTYTLIEQGDKNGKDKMYS